MSKLRDNHALRIEALDIILNREGPYQTPREKACAILDAVDRHLAQVCCEQGAKLAEDWVARYKCPVHGWQDNPGVVAAHPSHLQGEACESCGKRCTCVDGLCVQCAPPRAPTPTTTIIEPTPGPSHRPGGPPSPPSEPASAECFECAGDGMEDPDNTDATCSACHGTGRPASPGGSGGGATDAT